MKMKKECIAMLLAGGRGSRLGVLTKDVAKPAVPFGGKYRIIDFPLSNCVNSGIDTVTQRKINNTILSTECNCRFCNISCKNSQPGTLSTSQ